MYGTATTEAVFSRVAGEAKAKVDYLADTRSMRLVEANEMTQLQVMLPEGEINLHPTPRLHKTLAERLGIPWAHYNRLLCSHPDLIQNEASELMRREPKRVMLRTLSSAHPSSPGRARCMLGRTYRPLDSADLVEAVGPALADAGAEIQSVDIDEDRIYLKAFSPRLSGNVASDEIQGGILIRNSEVGLGTVSIRAMTRVMVCSNGMVVEREVADFSQRHIGGNGSEISESFAQELIRSETRQLEDAALWSRVRDVATGIFDRDRFEELLGRMSEAAGDSLPAQPTEVIQGLRGRFDLSEQEGASMLDHLAAGGSLSRWGLVQAVTRASQDAGSYDRATELETIGGRILAMPQVDWAAIARSN